MATQKITLTELRTLVKNIVKEEKKTQVDNITESSDEVKDLAKKISIYNGQKGTEKQIEKVIKNFKGDLTLMKQFAKNRITESTKPKTQKIKLSEVRQLVRSMIKEESGIPLKDKIINYLKSIHGSEFDEFAAETALYWYAYGYHEGQFSDGYKILSTSKFKPSRLSNGIEDEDETSQMYYTDIVSEFENISEYGDEPMQESTKPKTQKIKLSEVRELVRSIIKEGKNKV